MKLLIELTESITQSMAADSIYSASKSLSVALEDSISKLKEALEWNDPGQMLPSIAPVTKWLQQNYHTNRKHGGYGVHSALSQLKSSKAFRQLAQNGIDAIDDNAMRDRPDGEKTSKNKQAIALGTAMIQILEKLPKSHLGNPANQRHYSDVAKSLNSNLKHFEGMVSDLARIKMRDRGIDRDQARKKEAAKKAKKEKGRVAGSQNQQAEQVVNNVLGGLPKDVANDIRRAISRSGNKLAALQVEMGKRGLL